MSPQTWLERLRSWLAGALFALAGKLDESYDVWLDDAPRREKACGATSWQQDGFAICRGPWGHDGGHIWEVM